MSTFDGKHRSVAFLFFLMMNNLFRFLQNKRERESEREKMKREKLNGFKKAKQGKINDLS